MYAILGATGNTGKAAAETLLAAGAAVRVVVRRADAGEAWAARGAEVALADIEDEAALTAAFRGATGVYLLSPPDMGTGDMVALATRRISAALAAAKASGVAHVVLLSSIGAQHPSGTGPIRSLHGAEGLIRASGLAATFLRAAYFQENWGAVLGVAAEHGVLPTFFPADVAIPMVATADIGAAAASALLDPPAAGVVRTWAVSGPRDYSPSDVAAALTEVLGKPVAAQEQPLSAVVPMFTSFGASEHVAGLFAEMNAGIAAGHVAWAGTEAPHPGTRTPADTLKGLLGRG